MHYISKITHPEPQTEFICVGFLSAAFLFSKRKARLIRLLEISRKRARLVVGLMSGTSHDGVDAAVAEITGSGDRCRVRLIGHSRKAYPAALKRRVEQAFDGPTGLICRLNFELGEFFADAALYAIKKAGLAPADVDLIGSHGQTIYHVPPGHKGGSTLQVGEGAVIARRTGIITVSDFRPADIAAGGHGAPLVPYADWVLFREKGRTTALQNIGGISNVTVVTVRFDSVTGFDTGPGCSLIDDATRILTGGNQEFDKGGKLASSGEIIPGLLAELLRHPYFRSKPPKSTGRETFGRVLVEKVVEESQGARKEDIISTLTHLTARSIHDAYRRFVFPRHGIDRIVLAGGGARNAFLVSLLNGMFEGIPVMGSDELGVPVMAREALCFAVLGNETACGKPSNVPSATGARFPAILGKISLM